MKYILQLHQDLPELAKAEVLALNPNSKPKVYDHLLIMESIDPYFKTLAFTKKACQLLFTCKIPELENKLKQFTWQDIYQESFCLRINKKELKNQEKYLSEFIWGKLKLPKVDLNNAKTKIELFYHKNKVFCGLLIYQNKDKPFDRNPENRPKNHPSTLKPKLAKVLINLSGLRKGTILDPFCGTGGILIESSLLNFKTIGYDLSQEMLNRAKINIEHFNLKNITLTLKDSTTELEKVDAIITDPPYGRASTLFKKDTYQMYSEFLKQAEKSTKKAVIIFPSTIQFKKILKLTNFKIIKIIKVKVHRSLTRNITILEQ